MNVVRGLDDEPYDAVLVINGTRQLAALYRCKKEGVRIVQRLGLENRLYWKLPVGFRGYLFAEIRTLIMRFIRSFFADHVVYQSEFVMERWNDKYGATEVGSTVGTVPEGFTQDIEGYRLRVPISGARGCCRQTNVADPGESVCELEGQK